MGESGQRGRLFGTDGVRGVAGYELTAALALNLSVAAAAVLSEAARPVPPVAVVGRDPRASGEFLEAAVVAGLASSGVDVLRLGVIPTPGVAYLTKALGAAFGVVISASHNPARDNGIKFFGPGGVKLPDAVEDQIEDRAAAKPPANNQLRPGQRRRRHPGAVPGPPAVHPARRPGQGAGRAADRGRLRARGGVPARAPGAGPGRGRGHRDRTRARRPEHQRRLRLHLPGHPGRGGRAARRGRRRGLRRRRRPVPGGRRRRAAARRGPDPDRARDRAGRDGPAGRRRGGGHGDVEPGLPRGDAGRRHRGHRDPGGRQARVGGHARRRVRARRGAVRAHHPARARHHRRRHPDQPAAALGGAPARDAAGRGGQDDAQVPAGPGQRARRRLPAGAGGRPRPSPGRRRRSATTGGCWSGRAAPSPPSG